MTTDRDSPVVLEDGDAADVLRTFAAESFDALVTDPPGGIGFMKRAWDTFKQDGRSDRDVFVEHMTRAMREALRVLKPGAYGLVWAIPRTSHWTAWALEDAGFEVRDRVSHLFGQGFPKSRNIGDGRGTALKPAVEDWWLVRKPLVGTVEANVAQFGTGALNIDACRITTTDNLNGGAYTGAYRQRQERASTDTAKGAVPLSRLARGVSDFEQPLGRWPANLVLSHSLECVEVGDRFACVPECAVRMLDVQSGELKSGRLKTHHKQSGGGLGGSSTFAMRDRTGEPCDFGGDTGGASRFFYCAKASRAEKEAGLEHRMPQIANDGRAMAVDNPYQRGDTQRLNPHPTVKSIALMRWLVRLVTPPGGRVIDLFCGSGTTGIACVLENLRFAGIDNDPEALDIAFDRIEHWYYEQHPERRPA